MKKIISILLVLIMTLLIASCSTDRYELYSTRTALISKENESLSTQFEKTKALLDLKRSKFTNEEWRSLINTSSTINMLISKFDAIEKLKSSEVSVADVDFLWQLATEGFYQARSVVVNKYSQMSPSVKVMINSFDDRVADTDTELAYLISRPSEENINNALILIAGTLNYSARMISTMALQL